MSEGKKKPEGLFILEGIGCLVFNKDFTQCALTKKDKVIYIYSTPDISKTDTWKLLHKLEAHGFYVSCLDWHPETNQILSCSHDKTVYVWKYEDNKWVSSNVVATTKLGYLTCKWNKRGDKFCTGTSAKHLFVGYFNTESNWWIVLNIKGHKSSVCCCAIDPTSLFVLSGSLDLRVYVASCYIPQIDDAHLTPELKPLAQKFGTIISEYKPNAWVTSVNWAPNGAYGIAASQNATIGIIDYKNNKANVIRCTHSPATVIIPNGNGSFYAIGYDRHIYEYVESGGKWKVKRIVTEENEKLKGKSPSEKPQSQNKENLAVHTKQSAIVHPSLISSAAIRGKEMITTDVTGFIKYWKL